MFGPDSPAYPYGQKYISCLVNCGYRKDGANVPNISQANVANIPDQTYTGQEIKPEVSVKVDVPTNDGGVTSIAVKDEHITVQYKYNIGPGIGELTVIGDGENFTGRVTKRFQITAPLPENCPHE